MSDVIALTEPAAPGVKLLTIIHGASPANAGDDGMSGKAQNERRKKSSLVKNCFFDVLTKDSLGQTCTFADQLLCSSLGSWCCLFGRRFAKAVAEAFHTATHVVHGLLCAGVKRMRLA